MRRVQNCLNFHGAMEMKTLIAFGTRYGATVTTADQIGKILREGGFDVHIINLQKEKVDDIQVYDLIVIGSGVKKKWTREARRFLKKFKAALQTKKIALFISSGWPAILKAEGKISEIEKIRQNQLIAVAQQHGLQPITIGLFNGIWDLPDPDSFSDRWFRDVRPRIEALGIKSKDNHYDFRNWDAIRNWARELVKKACS